MRSLGIVRARAASVAAAFGLGAPVLRAGGETDLQQISPLVWVMLAISVAGASITFSFLVYALWKFRDPTTKGRRYG